MRRLFGGPAAARASVFGDLDERPGERHCFVGRPLVRPDVRRGSFCSLFLSVVVEAGRKRCRSVVERRVAAPPGMVRARPDRLPLRKGEGAPRWRRGVAAAVAADCRGAAGGDDGGGRGRGEEEEAVVAGVEEEAIVVVVVVVVVGTRSSSSSASVAVSVSGPTRASKGRPRRRGRTPVVRGAIEVGLLRPCRGRRARAGFQGSAEALNFFSVGFFLFNVTQNEKVKK